MSIYIYIIILVGDYAFIIHGLSGDVSTSAKFHSPRDFPLVDLAPWSLEQSPRIAKACHGRPRRDSGYSSTKIENHEIQASKTGDQPSV